MKLVYVCSPYKAQEPEILKRNIKYARELTRDILLRGEAPVTTHLYMTQALREHIEDERNIGLAAGGEIIKRCDKLYVGNKYGISQGMKNEIHLANLHNVPVVYV